MVDVYLQRQQSDAGRELLVTVKRHQHVVPQLPFYHMHDCLHVPAALVAVMYAPATSIIYASAVTMSNVSMSDLLIVLTGQRDTVHRC